MRMYTQKAETNIAGWFVWVQIPSFAPLIEVPPNGAKAPKWEISGPCCSRGSTPQFPNTPSR